ncbi:hypothetical protein [Nostoc sp. ChiVER01]|uniref:hypothetical protein n=1 Tax=Nostoc sp. ChiVER01 TaxID=3075382 RepID=UPI002AD224F5|nr:hypothetical protein [Nostoc sp. ChiVER01]MDZ8226734.1 hypothetical protein [Nostoc sp. ChiVER01]
MAQHNSLRETENQLLLTGSEEIEIQILKGGQRIEESIRKLLREKKILLPDEDYIWKIFVGARWVFYPDGQFFFIPSPIVNLDTKLFPLSGTYVKVEDTFKFQGERQSPEGDIACVDGIIHTNGEIFRAEFIYSRDKTSEKISQVLSQNAQPPSIKIETIEGIEVPSTFNISLEGKTEAQSFSPLSGTLQILPCDHPNDPNPFFVELHTEILDGVNGQFLWRSFQGSSIEEGTANGAIAVYNGQVCIEFQPIPIKELRVRLTWDTINQGEMAEYLPTVGVDVNHGTLTFVIQGDRVSGSIHASGTVFNRPEQLSTYEAEFTGQRQVDNLELAETLPLRVESQTENAVAEAESFEEDEIPINSIFNVSITGRTEAQSFGTLTGTLMILRSIDPQDPNPFSVTLHTDIGLHITNGFIQWITFNNLGEHKQLESRVFIENGQIRLKVEPTQNLRTLMWKTLPKGTTSDVTPVHVHVERGNFTFSIKGNKISGEIHASGTTFDDQRELSTYDARIEGQRQVSHVAEEIHRVLNSSGFAGCWETKNQAFGQIELQEIGHKVSGTYTERGGGVIEGIVCGSRLDFTWKDEQAKGWGFLRAIFSQGTLTGLWGYGTDKTDIHSLIGTRQYPALLTNQNLTADDAQKLEVLAFHLWQQGRGELAIPLLEKVLNFYKSKRLQSQTQDTNNFLTSEAGVLNLLIHCEAQSNKFECLPERLLYALTIQQLNDPRRLTKQYFNNQVDDLIKIFNETLEQLQSLRSNLSQPQTVNQERIEIIEAFTLLTEQWEWLQNRLNHDCSELNNLKISVTNNKIASELVTWLKFDKFIAKKQEFFLSEKDKVAKRERKVFQDQIEIIRDFNIWLQSSKYENIKNATINELCKIDEIENKIKQSVTNNSKLTNFEKQLFMNQLSLIMILLLMTNYMEIRLMGIRNYATQIEEKFRLTETINSHEHSLANLSTHMESWRKELVRDIDKIEALGKGQLFFQKLVKILFQLGSYKQALVVSEKAKTRAFADLLATRSDIQERMRQISSKERVIFNIATAPSLTFEDILELVKH